MAERQHRVSIKISAELDQGFAGAMKRTGQLLKTTGDLSAQAFRNLAAGAGAVSAALMGTAIASSSVLSAINDNSARIGANAEEYQKLIYAARQFGTDSGAIIAAFRGIANSAGAAVSGSKEAQAAYRSLGVDVKDASGNVKSSTQLFNELTASLGNQSNVTIRNALAIKVLGRSALEMGALVGAGSEGLRLLSRQLEVVGGVASEASVKLGDALGDDLTAMKASVQGIGFALVDVLGPSIRNILIDVMSLVVGIQHFIRNNAELVKSVAKFALIATIAFSSLFVFAKLLSTTGAILSALSTITYAVVRGMTALFGATALASGGIALMFLEVTLLVTALTLLGVLLSRLLFSNLNDFIAKMNEWGNAIQQIGANLIGLNAAIPGMGLIGNSLMDTGAAMKKLGEYTQKGRDTWIEFKSAAEAAKAELESLRAELDALGKGNQTGGVELTDTAGEKQVNQVAEWMKSAVKPMADSLTEALTKGLQGTNAYTQQFMQGIADQVKALNDLIEKGNVRDLDFIRQKLTALKEMVDLQRGLGRLRPGDTSRKEFGETGKVASDTSAFKGLIIDATEITAQYQRNLKGITNKLQDEAVKALEEFGDMGVRVAQSLIGSFMDLGNLIGDFVYGLLAGRDELAQMGTELRIQELNANLATTTREQERWERAAANTRKAMDRLELSALQNQSAWGGFFKSMGEWIAQLISDLVALIAKFAILKALSSIGGPVGGFFGKLLSFAGGANGLLVPKMAGGGILRGGQPGVDSIPALLAPGELVLPSDMTERFLANLQSPSGVSVHINAGLLAGDEGTARELARMVQKKLRFLDTGKTI